jgi:abortive infection bacteriophage resistance protein
MLVLQPTKTPNDLITHIENTTSIVFSDKKLAENYLKFINYDRIKPYIHVFNLEKKGIDFVSIINHYEFERDLKILAWNAIERIEVGVKRAFISQITGNELWYCNNNNYDKKKNLRNTILLFKDYIDKYESSLTSYFTKNYKTTPNKFDNNRWLTLKEILFGIIKSQEDSGSISINKLDNNLSSKINSLKPYLLQTSITHSNDISLTTAQLNNFLTGVANAKIGKYNFASFILFCMHIPFYLIVEKISFGALYRLFNGLSATFKNSITNEVFANLDPNKTPSNFKKIVTLRNSIAHHDNLFNNKDYKNNPSDVKVNINTHLSILSDILDTVSRNHHFKEKLNNLIISYVSTYHIDISFWGLSFTLPRKYTKPPKEIHKRVKSNRKRLIYKSGYMGFL